MLQSHCLCVCLSSSLWIYSDRIVNSFSNYFSLCSYSICDDLKLNDQEVLLYTYKIIRYTMYIMYTRPLIHTSSILIAPLSDIRMFYIRYLTTHKAVIVWCVRMYGKIIHSLELVDYLPVDTHKPNNNLHMVSFDICALFPQMLTSRSGNFIYHSNGRQIAIEKTVYSDF